MPCACSSAARQGHWLARSLDLCGAVGTELDPGSRAGRGSHTPTTHRLTRGSALSSRRLAGFLPGDLFAWLGADSPGGGHIPFITAYLGCQAGLGGGLRLSRALAAQVPAAQVPASAETSGERRPPGSACCVQRRGPTGPVGSQSPGGRGQARRTWGRGLPVGAPDAPGEGGPQELCSCFSRPCRILPEPPTPGSPPPLALWGFQGELLRRGCGWGDGGCPGVSKAGRGGRWQARPQGHCLLPLTLHPRPRGPMLHALRRRSSSQL